MLFTFDWRMAGIALSLTALGIVAIWSGNLGSTTPYKQGLYLRQALWLLIGLCALVAAAVMNYRILARLAYLIYGVAVFLLVAVAVAGQVGFGAQRWIRIGFLSLQPSEFMKLALILVLARYFEDHKGRLRDLRLLGFPILLAVVPLLIILRQPDLGTAAMLGLLTLSIFLLVGLKMKHLLLVGAGGAVLAPLLWSFLKDYQKQRLFVFLNPNLDPLGSGYHITQSKIAVGSGELFGKGLMAASQSQLNFLPASHTDFIFAVLAEQWGFVGCLLLLLFYYLLITRGIEIASEAKDLFGAIMAFGIVVGMTLQLVINVGMVVGIMPVVGIPLPLVSYGGSSLLVTLTSIGLVISVHMRRFLY
jgi:rod shape determining protein RodA